MFLKPYYHDGFSHAAYLVGGSDRTAVVMDPRGDAAMYLADADAAGLTITHVVGTHPNPDILAGSRALARRTGAEIWLGAGTNARFDFHAVRDGDTIGLGSIRLHVLSTPGSTPQSLTVIADLHQIPTLAFTGDTLLLGGVGRPERAVRSEHPPDMMARTLFRSLQDKILTLPYDITILPARGLSETGSKTLSETHVSTLARQLTENAALRLVALGDEDGFVRSVTSARLSPPRVVARAPRETACGATAHDGGARPVSAATLRKLRNAGEALVLDTRSVDAFGWAHIPDAVHVAWDTRFAERLGAVLPPDTRVIVVAEPDQEGDVVTDLARLLPERVIGWLDDGVEAWEASGEPTVSLRQITVRGLRRLLRRAPETIVVDVQARPEANRGRIAGAIPVPLPNFAARLADIPANVPLVLICDTGECSSAAASLLLRAGRGEQLLGHVTGGWEAWKQSERQSLAAW